MNLKPFNQNPLNQSPQNNEKIELSLRQRLDEIMKKLIDITAFIASLKRNIEEEIEPVKINAIKKVIIEQEEEKRQLTDKARELHNKIMDQENKYKVDGINWEEQDPDANKRRA